MPCCSTLKQRKRPVFGRNKLQLNLMGFYFLFNFLMSNHLPLSTGSFVFNAVCRPPRCFYCTGEHFTDAYPKFATHDQQCEQVNDSCFVCLRSGHTANACMNARPCYHCQLTFHHRSICPKLFSARLLHVKSPLFRLKFANSDIAMCGNTSTVEVDVSEADAHSILMQTAAAEIQTTDCENSCTVRVFFKTRSTRSFVHISGIERLNFQQTGHDVLSIAHFSPQSRTTRVLPSVALTKKAASRELIPFVANMTDSMSCPMLRQTLDVAKHIGLMNVQLAESPPSNTERVSIHLIGNYYYYDFVGGDHVNLPSGLTLQDTKLGYNSNWPCCTCRRGQYLRVYHICLP